MVRVLIDRRLAEDGAEGIQRMMKEMRREAIHRPGYVSGETLRDLGDPRHFVILSTWRTRADWDAWALSAERGAVEDRIALLLAEPETISIFEPV